LTSESRPFVPGYPYPGASRAAAGLYRAAVKAFAGDDHGTAVFYPEDDRFLVERDERSAHFEVVRRVPASG